MLLLKTVKAISMDLHYPEDVLNRILESEPRYDNLEQEEKCQVGTVHGWSQTQTLNNAQN